MRGIVMSFSLTASGNYAVFARLNCPSIDDDSFWGIMDSGVFTMSNGLGTRGWSWVKLNNFRHRTGKHILTIAYPYSIWDYYD
jgi:hypothetical protein